MTELLLPLLDALPEPPVLVGYCLGGTLALAAAALRPVEGVALIATPWHFAGFGTGARARIAALWQAAEPTCAALGLVPMEVLQSGFWRLDPARTVAKFEAFGTLDPRSPKAQAFVALEDWADAGAPLTYAAGRQLFEGFFGDDLPGTGRWQPGQPGRARRARLPGDRLRGAGRPHRAGTKRGRPARPTSRRCRPCRHGGGQPRARAALAATRRLDKPGSRD